MPKNTTKIVTTLNHKRFFADRQILTVSTLEQQGHCNQNYLLHTDKGKYILRIFGQEKRDRNAEYHIQHLAFMHKLAPRPIILDLETGFMVSEYIPGKHINTLSTRSVHSLSRALFTLHSISLQEEHVSASIEQKGIEVFEYDPVLCHRDLNPYNILWEDDMPTLIDWEYAGVNDRYFDLAAVTVEFKLDKQMCALFLKSYFDDHGAIDTKKLHAYQTHYQNLCGQWWQEKRSLQADSQKPYFLF